SYLYVNPANGNLRADGVLPKKEDINYSNYEWYFIPIEGGEPGWYYVKNGSGKLLYNNGNNVITVGEPGEGHYPEWRFFKTHIYTTAEQEYNFRMVQYVKEKACHMIRSGNSFITTNNSFTTANTTLLIKPADDYYLHNNDMELITNYEPYKVSSSISLDPPFLMDPDSSQCIINSYYFPANFKRLGSSGSLLMYDPSDRNSYYFIRMKQNDSIRTFFSHKKDTEDELVNYKINVKVRSSQIDQSPASLRVINQANDEYQEYALYVKKTDEWYDYQFYISLKNFDNDQYIDIYTSLDRKDS
ncbi:MAG: hypothetical protein LIO93_01160, partial [Bacteroidales bacterium]|nr:hypothetical protein [Bacteroidales bacterium]